MTAVNPSRQFPEAGLMRWSAGTTPRLSVVLGLSLLLLTGCSSVPDWAKPTTWYDSVFGEDELEIPQDDVVAEEEGDGGGYPSVGSVPERTAVASAEERRRIARDLAADRENARYTDDVASQTTAPQAPPAPAPGVPRAAPTTEVARTPLAAPPAALPAEAREAPEAPEISVPALAAAPAPESAAPPPAAPPQAPDVASPAPESGPGTLVSETYRGGLEQSRPTISTAPAGPTFQPSQASPLPRDLAADIPSVVIDQYNESLGPNSVLASLSSPFEAGFFGRGRMLATVRFGNGSAQLSGAARRAIREAARTQRETGGLLRVIGHASSRTRDMPVAEHKLANFEVSLDRAQAVADALIRSGVDPSRVVVEARSDSEPVYYEFMPAGEAQNRRAEIFLE